MIQVTRASASELVRAAGVAALVGALGGGLAACSGDSTASNTTSAGGGGTAGTSGATSGTSSSGGASGTSTPAASGTPVKGSTLVATGTATKGVEGSETAGVKIASCKATKTGVAVEASVTNTTTGPRTFVIAVKVRASGKDAGGAAVLATNVAPGKTVKATGATKTPVKGAPTCTVANVNGIDG